MNTRSTSSACAACGRTLPRQQGRGRPKQYCDATCRSAGRRARERGVSNENSTVKATLTRSGRQDYVDVMTAADNPAGLTADRIMSVAGQLAAELTQTGAGAPLAAVTLARELATAAKPALP